MSRAQRNKRKRYGNKPKKVSSNTGTGTGSTGTGTGSSGGGGDGGSGSGGDGGGGKKNNNPGNNNNQQNNNQQKKVTVSQYTQQGKKRTPAQMAAAERRARGQTIQSVKAAQEKKMREAAAERHKKFQQTRVQTDGGRRTDYTAAEKKRIRDAGYSVEGYGQASARSDSEVAAHRKQQSQFSSDRLPTSQQKDYESNRERRQDTTLTPNEGTNVAQKFVDSIAKIFKTPSPLPKSGEVSTLVSKTFGLPSQAVPTALNLFGQPPKINTDQTEVATTQTGGLNIKTYNPKRKSNSSTSRTVDAVASNTNPQVEPIIQQYLPTPTSNMSTPQDIAKVQADTYNKQMTAYGVPNYSAQFQQTTPRPLKRKREYFNRDFFTQYV